MKMKNLIFGIVAILSLSLSMVGCGGGGSGSGSSGNGSVTGVVLNVETGGPTNPPSSVQAGSSSILTNATDGSFALVAPIGTTSLSVDAGTTLGIWNFGIPSLTGTEDAGTLWVGPNRTTVAGTVIDASTNLPIAGANVSFGGVTGVTSANGTFSLPGVAYPQSNFASFWGIVGSVQASNYFANSFSTQPNTAVNGVVTVSNVLLTPLSSSTPPNTPYDIWGRITPSSIAPGTTVTLLQAGTPVRQTIADSTGSYYFWITPGSYTITYANGTHTAPTQSVTVTSASVVQEFDVVLN